jgi:hypothetical protein
VLRRSGLLALLCCLASCTYVQHRLVDFVDQYRIAAGVGTVIGVRGRALGLFDSGLMIGVKPRASAIGIRYSNVLFFNQNDARLDVDQAEIIKTTSMREFDLAAGSYQHARTSLALLPVVFTWVDRTPTKPEWDVPDEGEDFKDRHWMWSAEGVSGNRWTAVHAFDIEFEIGLFVYFDVGYSPGETLDFWLGIFGIDIAKDDGKTR